ncbi:LADA_0A01200g1_1 [Lachancea dasiensis]|uniref:LADA_0A01200g1_1 n=1 Tax=Lachancea dasiensis TaxID=1072105 RepID=A0A1G4IM13_9SACH|nr:LADA_0A01200g1_1 [Lachancea dasiensis]
MSIVITVYDLAFIYAHLADHCQLPFITSEKDEHDRALLSSEYRSLFVSMSLGIIVCRKQLFGSLGLYNVVPRNLSGGWEPQVRLFEGQMCVCELMSKNDDLPWYRLVFEWKDHEGVVTSSEARFFCQTIIMKGTQHLVETVYNNGEYYEILMECSNGNMVTLELRISDPREDQKFRDLLFRIREEYEMIDEMMQ